MKERIYQTRLIRRIEREFPGCIIIKNDPRYTQGIPDILILFGDSWAMLEIKGYQSAPTEPNQEHYVDFFERMSYCSFIYPENEDEVFNELQFALRDRRATRLS